MTITDLEKCNNYKEVITSLNELKNNLDTLILLLKNRKRDKECISHKTDSLSESCTTFYDHSIPYDLLVAIRTLVDYSEYIYKDRFKNANSAQDLNYQLSFKYVL